MFHIILFEPEIPPNAGNVMRLCANIGATLHLIRPLGFRLTDRHLRRAGLDYRDAARTIVHDNWDDCERTLASRRLFALSTRGTHRYSDATFHAGDSFLFGPETRGLPDTLLARMPPEHILRLPMVSASRSINLANAVAVVAFEAWRQIEFRGARSG